MKKVILCLVLMGTTAVSFGQQDTLIPPREKLLQKSKSQKAGAWMLAGTGVAFFIGAIASDIDTMFEPSAPNNTGLYLAGAASISAATVLFVAAGRNRRLARASAGAVSLKMERAQQVRSTGIEIGAYPSLALRVKL